MTTSVAIGVSACLLGEPVRYDGGHTFDRNITDTLGKYFTFIPVCPEVGCGLPVPRETMRLEGNPAAPRLVTCRTRIDRTEQMLAFCSAKLRELENGGVCGFIFKERSPSCGLSSVPLHGSATSGMFASGLFAHEVARCFPLMPLEEAERLSDPGIRKNFVEQIFLYHSRMDATRMNPALSPLR